MKDQQIQNVRSFLHDQNECVTVSRLVTQLHISRSEGSSLLKKATEADTSNTVTTSIETATTEVMDDASNEPIPCTGKEHFEFCLCLCTSDILTTKCFVVGGGLVFQSFRSKRQHNFPQKIIHRSSTLSHLPKEMRIRRTTMSSCRLMS